MTKVAITRSVNASSWPGPAPSARSRSRPRRSRSRDSCCASHEGASSPISLPSLRRPIPVQIRCDRAARAHPDSTSRSFRAAVHIPGTDTPQSPATPQTSYRAPSRKSELDVRRLGLRRAADRLSFRRAEMRGCAPDGSGMIVSMSRWRSAGSARAAAMAADPATAWIVLWLLGALCLMSRSLARLLAGNPRLPRLLLWWLAPRRWDVRACRWKYGWSCGATVTQWQRGSPGLPRRRRMTDLHRDGS